MPQPTGVLVDPVLTNISVAYIQAASAYIAGRVFPVVPVEKQTGKYPKYTKADWFRDEARRRAPSTESAGSGYNTTTGNYSCDLFAFHKDVSNQDRANAIAGMNPDRDATEFVTQRMLLRREKQWISDYFATSIWDTDLTPSPTWDDVTSDPIGDVETGKTTILSNTGFLPNKLTISYQVWSQLRNHPDLVDRIKYTAQGPVTPALVAALFGVDEVLIARAVENTANEGAATATYDFTHGKHALLTFSQPRPSLLMPSAGYNFTWRGISQGLGADVGISRFFIQRLKTDRVEGESAFDMGVVASDLGYFFNGAVA